MTVLEANYAREANHAVKADRADKSDRADRADKCDTAQQATYAMISKEAERLNLAGNMIFIDPTNHYIVMALENQDPSKAMIFDIANRAIYNVDQISKSDGTLYSPTEVVSQIQTLNNRIKSLESQFRTFSQI
jgi:hypothetical protein